MKHPIPMLVCVHTVLSSLLLAQPEEAWVQTYIDGPQEHLTEFIALDADRNVIVTGDGKLNDNRHIVTLKYHRDGGLLWARRFAGPKGDWAVPAGLGCDSAGNSYVAGTVTTTDSGDAIVVKYDRDGNEVWAWYSSPPAGLAASARALAVAEDGTVTLGLRTASQSATQASVVEIDADGRTRWKADFGSGHVNDVLRDENGFTYAVGQTADISQPIAVWRFTTAKYGPDGRRLWLDSIRFRDDVARAVAVDAAGNVIVTGEAGAGRFLTTYTTKLSPDGQRQWDSIIDGESAYGDVGKDIVVDSDGNAFVVAEYAGESGTDFLVVKLSPSGETLWQYHYNGPDNRNDDPKAIALTGDGSVVVTGSSGYPDLRRALTILLSPQGEELWIGTYTRPDVQAWARSLAVDPGEAIYITGVAGQNPASKAFTIKYTLDELQFRRGDCDGDGDVSRGVADALLLLTHSFTGGEAPPCLAACDVDGDGEVLGSVNDPIYLLRFLFLGGPRPVPPFPACGFGILRDHLLGCEQPSTPALCEEA